MLNPVGFWSYARDDDHHSDGQLSQLRGVVGKAISLRQGENVVLWQDDVEIQPGEDWLETINRTIGQVTFFIPIISPRFLKSVHCRDEFRVFRNRMETLGRNDLVFPIYYVDVRNIKPEATVFGDELAVLHRHQWIDFQTLVYEDPKSPQVRQWADRLATGILDALRRAPVKPITKRPEPRPTPPPIEYERSRETVPVPEQRHQNPAARPHKDGPAPISKRSSPPIKKYRSDYLGWLLGLATLILCAFIIAKYGW